MKFVSKFDAIGNIKSGNLLMFSGFQSSRVPIGLINEIVDQKISNLSIVSLPNGLPNDILVKNGLISSLIMTFNGICYESGFKIMPNVRKKVEEGKLSYYETDVYEIISRLKGGIEGKKIVNISWIKDSDYYKVNKYKKIDGKIYADSIIPDVAVIHAQKCDDYGNIEILDPLTDNLVWKSAKKIIVSVEEKVSKLENITIPGTEIDFIVILPGGAKPTSCYKYYNYQKEGLDEYLSIKDYSKIDQDIPEKSDKEKEIIDYLICVLSRQINSGDVVLTGVASPIPMVACLLAKKMKKFNYINCSGAVNPSPSILPFSSFNTLFLDNKEKYIELSDIFESDFNKMFMGGVQIDKLGNINMTCIGSYSNPKVKLPGPAATVYLRNKVDNPIIFVRNHSKRVYVEKVDFVTSRTSSDSIVVSDLGILKIGGKGCYIIGVSPYSSVSEIKNNTGFELIEKLEMDNIDKPRNEELNFLNILDKKGIRYKY